MNSKISLVIIGIAVSIIIIFLASQNITKPEILQNNSENMNKEILSTNINESTLSQNYTSLDLLNYCTKNESQIYNDICIRGLWEVGDNCKNANFSSNNFICNDPRFYEFEKKVNREMQDLNKSLTKFVESCMNVTTENDIQNCFFNMERIKNDCTDERFISMWSVCSDPKMELFSEKYGETLSKLKPSE